MAYIASSCDKIKKKKDAVYMTELGFKTLPQQVEAVIQDKKST